MSLQERIDEIRARGPVDEDRLGRPVRCIRCRDTGVIEYTGGTITTHRGLHVEASPDRPVYRRCTCLDTKPEEH